METLRFLAVYTSLVALSAGQDIFMGVAADKNFVQQGPFKLGFTGGELNLLLRDGLVIIDGTCVTQPQPVPFPPSDIPPCPLGATGFVAQGDIDRDGIRDDLQYWSVLSIIPAFLVEPSRPELCVLSAGPASKLPHPLQNFRDDSLVTFYDIRFDTMTDYDQTRYELVRTYGSVAQVETIRALGSILNDGNILVTVTGAGIAGSPLAIPVPVTVGQPATAWGQAVRLALAGTTAVTDLYEVSGSEGVTILTERVPNGNDSTLLVRFSSDTATSVAFPISSVNTVTGVSSPVGGGLQKMNEELVPGQYVFSFPRLNAPTTTTPVQIPVILVPMPEPVGTGRNPRVGFRFTSGLWDSGFMQFDPRVINQIAWTGNDSTVVRPGDRIYFSIANETSPGGSAAGGRDFPPTGNEVLLTSPINTSYNLPPFFLNVGDQAEMLLSYQRNLPSNGIAFDVSDRNFRVKLRMIDSYNGFSQITFPLGSSPQVLQPTADVDFDGMDNINEFAFEWPTREQLAAELFFDEEQPMNEVNELGFGVAAAIDPLRKPVVPVATLDAENHIVVRASLRPLTGTSLKYTFVTLDTSGKKPKLKQIKPGRDWQITRTQETETVLVGATNVDLPHDYIILRSAAPVADPAAPLPNIQIKVTSVPN